MTKHRQQAMWVLLLLLLLSLFAWRYWPVQEKSPGIYAAPINQVKAAVPKCAPVNSNVKAVSPPNPPPTEIKAPVDQEALLKEQPRVEPATPPPVTPEVEPALEGPQPAEGEKYVLGRVVDADTEEGISGAEVFSASTRAYLGVTKTNSKGRFRIVGIPATNKIRLFTRHSDYISALNFVEPEIAFGLKPVPEFNSKDLGTTPVARFDVGQEFSGTWAQVSASPVETIVRICRGTGVEGTVVNEGDQPVEGAIVSTRSSYLGFTVMVRSSISGQFTLGKLPGGRRSLVVGANSPGLGAAAATILELGYPKQPWNLTLKLALRGTIQCRFVPFDGNSTSSYLVRVTTEQFQSSTTMASPPNWNFVLNGLVPIGVRFRILVAEVRDSKFGPGFPVAQSEWFIAQRENDVVVHEQSRTRIEASLEGLGLDWNDIYEVSLTVGDPGCVSGSAASVETPPHGKATAREACLSLVTETAQAEFIVVLRIMFKPKPVRDALHFTSEPMRAAPGSTVAAVLKPLSRLFGGLKVRVTNRQSGHVVIAPFQDHQTIGCKVLRDGDAGDGAFTDLIAGQWRVWWLPELPRRFGLPPEWAKECVVKASETGELEITVPD